MVAYVCAIAMVVASIVYVPTTVSAGEIVSGDVTYSIADGGSGNIVGFVFQGAFPSDNPPRFAFAWNNIQGPSYTLVKLVKDGVEKTLNPMTSGSSLTTTALDALNLQNGNYSLIFTGGNKTDQVQTLTLTVTGAPDPTTQAPTEAPTEETQAPTEAPSVEPSTEAPTEVTTEAPASEWVSTNKLWALRKSDGTFDIVADGGAAYTGFNGIAAFYSGDWGGGDVDVKQPAPSDANKLDIRVNSVGTTAWSMQVRIYKTGLDSEKVYAVKLKAGSTVLFEDSLTDADTYAKAIDLAGKLTAGETTLELSIEEQEQPPEPPEVQDITITPKTGDIEANHNIWAEWTNPEGTAKAYAYLKETTAGYDVIAANGWDFNSQAGQPMVAVDNVNHSKNNEITVEEGGTYKFIVESYDAFGQKTGYGEVDITIPSLTPEEKEAQEYLAKINTDENLALNKTPLVAVGNKEADAKNICDGNNGSRWQADKTVDNTWFAVDLGSVNTVDKVLVSWEASNAKAYEIYTAGEDGEYGDTPVATVSGLANNKAVARLSKDLDVSARYVKVVVTEWSDNAANYGISPYELAVFGESEEPSTEAPSESPSVEPSTEAPTEEPSTETPSEYANLKYTRVGTTDYYVAANRDEFGFQILEEQVTNLHIVPNVATGTKPIWPDFTNETLNGESGSYSQGAGIFLDESKLTEVYNVYEATSAVDSHRFQIIVKVGAPTPTPTTEAPSESPSVEPSTEVPTEVTTQAPTQQPTTQAPTEVTTVAPTETQAPTEVTTQAPTQQPTTQAPTQKPTQAPTVKPSTPQPIPVIRIPDKAKVKKAVKKKKSAKKIKVKIKKVKGAKGYQVQVSKKKKGKALVKKFTTKTKITIKSKKFKKKKKLWVKVRAYTFDGTVKVFGAWSKPKKTKKK